MNPKGKLAAFFQDDDDVSFPQKEVDDQKLSKYTQGTTKKSRREKEKEAQEAKAREEEDLAAKVYDEFLETFEGDAVSSRSKSGPGFVKSGAENDEMSYAPKIRGRGAMNSKAFEPQRPASPPGAKAKGKRAMDKFLEEIKREQAERESRLNRSSRDQGRSVTALAAYETQSGSRDRGDLASSNLFMANLPTTVSEPSLGNFCARFGPVASVKIMWPRVDDSLGPGSDMTTARRVKNSGLSGFVSFMKRKDAEAALRELDGFEWGGSLLRVGWSKAVPVGPRAMYGQQRRSQSPKRRSHSRSRSRSPSGERDRRRHRSRSRSRERDWEDRGGSRSRSDHYQPEPHRIQRDIETYIKVVAGLVKEHGNEFEDNLKEKEASNPLYSFLTDVNSREHRLYKSLLRSSELSGPAFWDEGYDSVYSTDSAEESERERGPRDRLGRLARRRFEAMLRALTSRRGEIARCMVFSLEHAESASEISDIIISSMLVDTTAVPRKVARLYLVCDILHNSAAAVSNAWKFRQEFQSRLGLVFDHFSTIYHSFPGRMTANIFKSQIIAVVEVWENAIVFPPEFTNDLRVRLDGGITEQVLGDAAEPNEAEPQPERQVASRFKSSSFQPATVATNEDNDSVDMAVDDQLSDTNAADVDGEPIPDDVDGEPIMDDVDGEAMVEDLDGEPISDVDGEPL